MVVKAFLFLLGTLFAINLCAATGTAPIVVGFYSPDTQKNFDEKIKPLFDKQTQGCAKCQIMNLTPYDDKGKFNMAGLEKSLQSLPPEVKILFFDFNIKKGEVPASTIETLTKVSTTQGVLVVASAGMPHEQQASSPLSHTLFGQVKDAIIIGELGERDRLLPQSFFGPEMLTALRPPLAFQGEGPLLFTSKLAADYNRRSPQEWTDYIRSRKQKSRKIWPELQDFFN